MSAKTKVLFVDDEKKIRELFSEAFSDKYDVF